ncbi:type IV secretory pathway TraG/TraD family ATPase VirD4 [Kordia periserrulae]|uniref:Type IV secretory pathway TraG/TraD family ATPase VirD4 n=1 Tax=Kordia periserrulae TaxID=701523 RepID=A0A2T6BRA6_9FLAO|nr:type IV secretory system conjugative DNA transfer family protein [Kordia periserrulae]PTX58574.1 type IV secretory pathway TraG/TraD family ATPase VirD4 [Kordia periserrulae]
MFKTILRYVLIGILVYYFRGFFETILPIPTENMVDGTLNLEVKSDRNLFHLLRFVVWMFVTDLVIRYARPFFSFAAPAARRYSVTKPFRRIQGVFGELFLLFIIFLIPTLFGFIYSIPKSYSEKKDETIFNIKYKYAEELAIRDKQKVANKVYEIAKETNEWLSYQARNVRYNQVINIPVKHWLPSSRGENLSFAGRDINYLEYDADDETLVKVYFDDNLNLYNAHTAEYYKNQKKIYDEQVELYNEFIENFDTKVLFDYYGTYEVENNENVKKALEEVESKVWEEVKSNPFPLLFAAANRTKYLALIIALAIYLLSYFSTKDEFSRNFEKIIRVVDQSRFGLGGSARFAGLIEEWSSLYKNQKYSLFLGKSLYNPFLIIGSEDPRHMLTIAGTRGGKGTTAIIPNLLLWEGSALVIDPKGTNAAVTARRREEMGQDVYLVDPFNIVNKDKTDAFNPLAFLDPNAPDIREKINLIAEALVVPDPEPKEKHWDDGARTIIAGLIGHIISSDKFKDPKLSTIRELLSLAPDDQKELWIDMMMNEGAGRLPIDTAARVLRGISTSEMSSILSNADKHTEWLSSPVIQKALNESTFDFKELKENPTTIYLILPPELLETHNRFIRLFINLVLAQISIGGKSKTPILMIMDEFTSLGRMKEVEKAFGLLASYNLVMWPFIQDLGTLKDIYKGNTNTFINNSRAVQVFAVSHGETTKFISEKLGDRRLKSYARGSKGNDAARLRTESEVALDISAESNRQYILRAGKPPLLLEKVPYYKDNLNEVIAKVYTKVFASRFQGMYDKDPDYKS